MYQDVVVRSHSMFLGQSHWWDELQEAFCKFMDFTGQTNEAIQTGKALDQLRERVRWSCGISNATIEVQEGMHDCADMVLCLLVSAPLSPEQLFQVGQTVAQVNSRFKTQIRLLIRKVEDDNQ